MNAEDTKVIMDYVKSIIPKMSDIQKKEDDITKKTYFVGTTEDQRVARFEISGKVTQISKAPKVKA